MVGHTGVLESAVKACEAVDECLGKVHSCVEKLSGILIVTADHGNCDIMYDKQKQEPHTAHTLTLLILLFQENDIKLNDGVLGDIAPTILYLLGIEKPIEMTGGKPITMRLLRLIFFIIFLIPNNANANSKLSLEQAKNNLNKIKNEQINN